MPMSEREAVTLVDTLRRGYPTYPFDAGVQSLYVEALKRCPFGADVASAAVASYIVNESWMPKVNELLDVIEVEAASRNATRRGLPRGSSRSEPNPDAKLAVEIMRTVLEEMPPPGPHVCTGHGCSLCAAVGVYADRFVTRCRELSEARGVALDDDSGMFSCARCHDTGFESEPDGQGGYVCTPCPCFPERYDRWRDGHFEPNHHCAACDLVRKGRR